MATNILLDHINIIDSKIKVSRIVVAIFLRKYGATMFIFYKLNSKGGIREFYHKYLNRNPKTNPKR